MANLNARSGTWLLLTAALFLAGCAAPEEPAQADDAPAIDLPTDPEPIPQAPDASAESTTDPSENATASEAEANGSTEDGEDGEDGEGQDGEAGTGCDGERPTIEVGEHNCENGDP